MPAAAWPLYFARRPLDAIRIRLRPGDPFPLQDKSYIRGLARAYGISDGDRRPFGDLDYVESLDVHSEELRHSILERGMNINQARHYVARASGKENRDGR